MPRKTTHYTKEFFAPSENREKKENTQSTQKTKEFPWLEKTTQNQDSKEKKIRVHDVILVSNQVLRRGAPHGEHLGDPNLQYLPPEV